MTLADSGLPGGQVGAVAYSDGLTCGGNLSAVRAEGHRYVVQEHITWGSGCVATMEIRLVHDPIEETLAYEFGSNPPTHGGTAVLRRE